ncbi:MAG: hypothetical protein KDK71_08980 [Chlamydiia bacterium]|nr:hypothetical protein [Chlamydiia bacterium]
MEKVDGCEQYDCQNMTPNYTVSSESVENYIGTSPTVMVYGFADCQYEGVILGLKNHPTIYKVFDHSLGYDWYKEDESDDFARRLDGTKIHQISSGIQNMEDSDDDFACKMKCKAALVNQVLENYRAVHIENRDITPILFCIDYENKTTGETLMHPLTSENILSKTKILQFTHQKSVLANELVTHSELRRAYRLCFDESIDPEIRSIAQRTFKFIKVKETTEDLLVTRRGTTFSQRFHFYDLEQVEAPWERHDFADELKKRNDCSIGKQKSLAKTDWKNELNLEAQKIISTPS